MALLFLVLLPLKSFSQNTKSEKDVSDCIMIMEINAKKYCVSNVSYNSSFNETPAVMEDTKVITPLKVDNTYYLTANMNRQDLSQELLDWALINPSKKQNGVIKIYNPTKTKLLKEIKFDDAALSSFSDNEDTTQQSYSTASFSFNCKKLTVKLL